MPSAASFRAYRSDVAGARLVLARGDAHPSGHWVLWVRFKAIKQDPRIERPSASESVDWLPFEAQSDGYGRDWVPIGDVPGNPLFSIARWYMQFCKLLRCRRQPGFGGSVAGVFGL